ncbi:Spo0E like sporulation regulatory protein [Desulfosporosinus acidiphilus SJ4]|uniref:Spo0E like sporulation regulatory protein n=1 Tax=Desulfosporosinus acidiphilus (strain DSM 22704 / JCM 16185 / SJ4) TaxID=646529 RepID=I4D732_DESAJ|nr:aspartyl-phosphate phosphatase Spo0E family protein [Desulfosporosinus acidiphilus]AFM41606.1 Spo0E like sporulation regulatory protein [Desulfosporosinus acidiphilus SJ4]
MYGLSFDPNEEVEKLNIDIEDLRMKLINEVQQKRDLLDPEVIKLSQRLDRSLNQFYRLTFHLGQK